MKLTGFSTGSIALSDYKKAVKELEKHRELVNSIELSALRETELEPLINDLDKLKLSGYIYVSFHAPSGLKVLTEKQTVELLKIPAGKNLNIILHPDVIKDYSSWKEFGELLLIENMDKRKPIGRTLEELDIIYSELPEAGLCFDIAHSRQVDPTMYEAKIVLKKYGDKLKQVHISEVNSQSKHVRMSYETILAFTKVADLIPSDIPVIIESPVNEDELSLEVYNVLTALKKREPGFDYSRERLYLQ